MRIQSSGSKRNVPEAGLAHDEYWAVIKKGRVAKSAARRVRSSAV